MFPDHQPVAISALASGHGGDEVGRGAESFLLGILGWRRIVIPHHAAAPQPPPSHEGGVAT